MDAEWGFEEAPSLVGLLEAGGSEAVGRYLNAHPEDGGRIQKEMGQLSMLSSAPGSLMRNGEVDDAARAIQVCLHAWGVRCEM